MLIVARNKFFICNFFEKVIAFYCCEIIVSCKGRMVSCLCLICLVGGFKKF
ncbi:hypothetical protein Hanom_Chr06g00491741 [Helianthus anomalus]